MAYLIDESYFKVENSVPNTTEVNSGSLIELTYFIDKYSRLLLLNVLGYELLKEMDSFLSSGLLPSVPTLPAVDPVPVKWRNLITGVEYTKDGKLVKWKGLIYTDGSCKASLIADYVYAEWLKFSASQVTGIGEVNLVAKNSIGVNPTQRYVNVWNDFVEMYQGKNCNSFRYVENFNNYYNNFSQNKDISLIGFLKDNPTDYPEVTPYVYKIQNQLGL